VAERLLDDDAARGRGDAGAVQAVGDLAEERGRDGEVEDPNPLGIVAEQPASSRQPPSPAASTGA
jgi:hypothetical protein